MSDTPRTDAEAIRFTESFVPALTERGDELLVALNACDEATVLAEARKQALQDIAVAACDWDDPHDLSVLRGHLKRIYGLANAALAKNPNPVGEQQATEPRNQQPREPRAVTSLPSVGTCVSWQSSTKPNRPVQDSRSPSHEN